MPGLPVTPSPRFPLERLLTLVRTISGVQAVWSTKKRGFLGLRPGTEMAYLVVSSQSNLGIGVDELRVQYDPARNENAMMLRGQRSVTIVLRAISFTQTLQAFDLLERVRFRMRTKVARDIMVPTIALKDFGPIVNLEDETQTSGGVSIIALAATMDMRLLYVVGADPGDAGQGDFIATVNGPGGEVTGKLT
jgi:hypothetical protein